MEKYNDLEIRCPRLGGEVTFGYCMQERGDLPCPRVINCWQGYFPVESFLKEKLTPQEWDRCFNRPPENKIATILDIAEALNKQKRR